MATIDYLVTDTELSDIADAIRAKGGTSAQLTFPAGFTTAIAAIPTGTTVLNPLVMRPDAEIVYKLSYDKYIVADEGISFPAYTTSQETLIASEKITPAIQKDTANYNYFYSFRSITIPVYSITTKAAGRVEYNYRAAFYEIVDYPAGDIEALIDTTKTTSAGYSMNSAGNHAAIVYWNSDTTIRRMDVSAYGVPVILTAPTTNSSTITFSTPSLVTRGHSTYFTSTFMNAVTDVRYQYIIELYRAPKGNLSFDGWGIYGTSKHIMDCVHSATGKLT